MSNDLRDEPSPHFDLDPQRLSIVRWWHDLNEKVSGDHSHRKVLVADDEAGIRNLMGRVLRNAVGCQTLFAETGDEVLEIFEREACDVLIADMIMPGVHGLELISQVRERWPDVDVMVMTGFPDVFPYVEVIRAGASDFIAKPHKPGEIEAKLLRLFNERELRERLVLAEAKYRSLFELAVHGELLISADTYEIIDANRAFAELIGHEREAVIGMRLLDLVDIGARDRLEQSLNIFASGGQGSLSDITLFRADGGKLSADIAISFITVPHERIVFLSVRDVTDRLRVVDELAVAVQTDALTGLSNKPTLFRRLEALVPVAQGRGEALALLFIDVDDFKRCNDTYGHQAGDEVLKSVGRLIRKCIRDGRGDEGFRYGGDEFAVLLSGTPKECAKVVAERVCAEFGTDDHHDCTLSIGVAEIHEDMEPKQFFDAADKALYEAKARGKNTIHVA